MDWKRAMQEERAVLDRIVALLCAMAGLAEVAAGRSPLVRALVLMFLRRAEAVVRDFVGDPEDAMRLAAGLRALARQVDREALQALDKDRGFPPFMLFFPHANSDCQR